MAMTSAWPQVAAFTYHEVTDDPSSSGFQRLGAVPYKLTPRAFAEHLARIAAGPVAPTRVTDIDFTRPGRFVVLTFDDGGKSALYAGDELCRRGWTGHFFVVSGLIGRRTFMTAGEIRHLVSCGHVVGTHSHTHPDIFPDLTAQRMLEEWRTSCDILADLLGEPCPVASVPGGDISPAVLHSAAGAGLRHLFTSEPWTRPRRVDGCWILGRFGPKTTTPPARTAELARFRGWGRALLVRQLKEIARQTMPTLYRFYVRQTTREWAAR